MSAWRKIMKGHSDGRINLGTNGGTRASLRTGLLRAPSPSERDNWHRVRRRPAAITESPWHKESGPRSVVCSAPDVQDSLRDGDAVEPGQFSVPSFSYREL